MLSNVFLSDKMGEQLVLWAGACVHDEHTVLSFPNDSSFSTILFEAYFLLCLIPCSVKTAVEQLQTQVRGYHGNLNELLEAALMFPLILGFSLHFFYRSNIKTNVFSS